MSDPFTATALALAAAGTATTVVAGQQQGAAQRRAEEQRKKAMELDAQRKMMETVRMQQRARAMALATTTAQGASFGSGLGGAFGQVAGQTGVNQLGISQNLELGRNIFDANMDASRASSIAGIGQGLQSLGGQMLNAQPQWNALRQTGFNNRYLFPNFMTNFNSTGNLY